MARSRRLVPAKSKETKPGLTIVEAYCRKCMQTKSATFFYEATNKELDTNGLMSVCKACCQDIYRSNLKIDGTIERAILRTCRTLDMKYDQDAIETTKTHIAALSQSGRNIEAIFGIYRQRLGIATKKNSESMCFTEPSYETIETMPMSGTEEDKELKKFWGDNYTLGEINYLEEELADWKKTHKCDTKAEESLLVELCHKSLEIRKERALGTGHSTAELVKELQNLMKTASVDPAKTALIGSGRAQDTFSSFIKIIEENDPADYYKDKELFKDFDNIGWYFRKYVTRPLSNFIQNSRDFNVDFDEVDDEVDEFAEKSD